MKSKEIKLTSEPRLPKHKNCVHDWRFLLQYRNVRVFYCTKCLGFTFKDEDKDLKIWIKQMKKAKRDKK